ncbi:DNA adenine methylase [Pseudoxanthomonas sp. UTMC 1351]|uniref:DNA adenine methylase n=1 Tax=Pseudoxanthomonas sp. UTMC 1351 TaxID=2695853 RepID=UPI0034CD22FF
MPNTKTLFAWPGGKTRLLPHILPLIEATPHACYVEAFAGGAGLLFTLEPARIEVRTGKVPAWCSRLTLTFESEVAHAARLCARGKVAPANLH